MIPHGDTAFFKDLLENVFERLMRQLTTSALKLYPVGLVVHAHESVYSTYCDNLNIFQNHLLHKVLLRLHLLLAKRYPVYVLDSYISAISSNDEVPAVSYGYSYGYIAMPLILLYNCNPKKNIS